MNSTRSQLVINLHDRADAPVIDCAHTPQVLVISYDHLLHLILQLFTKHRVIQLEGPAWIAGRPDGIYTRIHMHPLVYRCSIEQMGKGASAPSNERRDPTIESLDVFHKKLVQMLQLLRSYSVDTWELDACIPSPDMLKQYVENTLRLPNVKTSIRVTSGTTGMNL